MRMRAWVFAGMVASCFLMVWPARATTLVSMSLDQLTQASSDVVQAHVINQVSRWNDSHTQVLTITTFAVTQTYKGGASTRVEIEQLGGTIGNMRVFVPGDVAFRTLEDYVLFLEPAAGTSRYHLVGMTQGAYRVYADSMTRQARVIQPAFSRLRTPLEPLKAGTLPGTLPLESFHKYVASVVSAGIQIPHGLNLPVAIVSAESRGVGRKHIYGKTVADLFPNPRLVIPAGTEVEGNATLASSTWTIHWDELNVRGMRAQISAINQEAEGSLRGRSLILRVR